MIEGEYFEFNPLRDGEPVEFLEDGLFLRWKKAVLMI